MNKTVEKEVILNKDLVIQHVKTSSEKLQKTLDECDHIAIDVSGLNKIDIAGLQLLIAFTKEVAKQSKTHSFYGELRENFRYSINHITFSSRLMSSGKDLLQFVNEML